MRRALYVLCLLSVSAFAVVNGQSVTVTGRLNAQNKITTAAEDITAGNITFIDVTNIHLPKTENYGSQWSQKIVDINSDNLVDLFSGAHNPANEKSYLLLQQPSGIFVEADYVETNHAKIWQNGDRRITSEYVFFDADGDGDIDFTGWDADGNPSAIKLNETANNDFVPLFNTSWTTTGFPSSQDFARIGDINGDGNIDAVEVSSTSPCVNTNRRRIVTMNSDNWGTNKTVVYPAITDTEAADYGEDRWYPVIDLDMDGWPEIIAIKAGGYWKNNAGTLVWQEELGFGTFQDPDDLCVYGYREIAGDFDNDGDNDVIFIKENRSISDSINWLIARNDGDGTFSDVTSGSGLPGDTGSQKDVTVYGHFVTADLDNDSRLDIVWGGEKKNKPLTILHNTTLDGVISFEILRPDVGTYNDGRARLDIADFNRDGLNDIYFASDPNAAPDYPSGRLLKNTTSNAGNWLNISVRGMMAGALSGQYTGNNTNGAHTVIRIYQPNTNNLIVAHSIDIDRGRADPTIGIGSAETVDIQIQHAHGGAVFLYEDVSANQHVRCWADGSAIIGFDPVVDEFSVMPPP